MTIVCEPDQALAGQLAAAIGDDTWIVRDLKAAEAVAGEVGATVIVAGPGLDLEAVLTFTTRVRLSQPAVKVILLRADLTPSTLTSSLAAGVAEVMVTRELESVPEAVRRAEPTEPSGPAEATPAAPRPTRLGKVFTVFSAKGGCGKTTLATNLAVVLHAQGAQRVCLVDLDLEFGDVAGTLGLAPARNLVDGIAWEGNLDRTRISTLVTPYWPGLDCILAPPGPGEGAKVSATFVSELLAVLPVVYEYVVVDLPARFSAQVLAALDSADHHLLLATPERPALKDLRLTLDTLDLLAYSPRTRSIVINRWDSRAGITAADAEELLRSPVAGDLPSRWDVPASINRGVPLAAAQPDHAVSRAVRRLAAERLPNPGPHSGPAAQQTWAERRRRQR